MRWISILIFLLTFLELSAQKLNNTASFRQIDGDKYFRLNFENDLFAGQDENYTQGFSFECVLPVFSKNPINNLFVRQENEKVIAGITLEHNAFTPYDYQSSEIQFGDRPFAATLVLTSFKISISVEKKQRVASILSLGIMGPAALGKEIQTGIHQITNNTIPKGWGNQIENQVIVNYGIDYEKEIFRLKDYFGLYANANTKVGNLYTNAVIGFNTRFGSVNNPYQNSSVKKNLLLAYVQPLLTYVVFNGTLQGGVFRNNSIYTIPNSDLSRLVGQLNYGLVLQTKFLYLEFSGSIISKEIKSVKNAAWGGIRLGINF